MTQAARVVLLANGGGTNLRAAWQANPAATWGSAPTANMPTVQNGALSVWTRAAYSPDLNVIAAITNTTANNNNQISVSPDGGANWIGIANPNQSTFTFTDICWSPLLKIFVAVASAGPTTTARVLTSPDGVNWTVRSLPDASKSLSGVAAATISGADVIVAVGTNMVYTSTDGTTWTARTPASSQTWDSICWNSGLGKFVACANSGSGTNNIMSSADGTSWASKSTGGSGYGWTRIAYSPSLDQMIVVGGNTGVICYSAAGSDSSWTQLTSGLGSNPFFDVAWCADQSVWVMVAPADGATGIYTSAASGSGWSAQTSPNSNNWAVVVCLPSATAFTAIGVDPGYNSTSGTTGIVGTASGTSSTAPTVAVTTTQKNEVLVMVIGTERLTAAGAYNHVTSITGGSGVTWTQRSQYQWRGGRNGSTPFNYNNLEVWWAPVTAIQSAVTFTVNLSAASDNVQLDCIGVVGADPTTPWDANGALPAKADAGVSQVASFASVGGVSTTNTHPFVLSIEGSSRAIAGGTAPTGYNELFHGGAAAGTDWENLGLSFADNPNAGAALSSATVTTATTQVISWGYMVDAMVSPVGASSTGTLSVTEALDTFAGTGVLEHPGPWASSEAVDTFAGTGIKGHTGTWASTEATDVSSATGDAGSHGVWASTEATDTMDATGVLTDFGGIVAGFDAHEAPDVFAATGQVTIVATWASAEAADIFNAFGKLTIIGTFTPTEAKDVFAGTATVPGVTGTWHSNEPVDIMTATGKVPRVGTWVSTENSDTAIFTGLGSTGTTARRIFFVT